MLPVWQSRNPEAGLFVDLSNQVFCIRILYKYLFPSRMKNYLLLSLALLGVIVMLYAGLNGIVKNYSYGFFFTFTGAITTVGLGLDVINHLKDRERRNSVRKLGRG